MTTSTKPEFVYTTYIRTTSEKLWSALTTDEVVPCYWFGNAVKSSWGTGDAVQSFDKDDGSLDWDGEVLESTPPTKLVFTFRVEGVPEKASQVTYLIEPAESVDFGPTGQAVKLTVIHEDFAADSQIIHGVSRGWPGILSNLKTMLESESGTPLGLMWKPPSE
ncbi:MAG: SRPBCC family protein [Verrucomicrobiia bacterium]